MQRTCKKDMKPTILQAVRCKFDGEKKEPSEVVEAEF
jgi:hypothetical protein